MEFALSENGERIKATRHDTGFCDICGEQLIPRCGSFYRHHWAHKAGKDCDPWGEPESDWHRGWKNLVHENFRERVITRNGVKHRADIRLLSGIVIELQHSPLSLETRCEREEFYENMIWIIHLPKAKINLIRHCFEKDLFNDYYAEIQNISEWIYQPPHACPILLDLDDDRIFHVTEFDDCSDKKRTRNLYGNYLDKKKFINFLKPTFFDDDLSQITLSHRHRDFYEIQNKLHVAETELRSVKKELHSAKLQKRYEERAEEWQRQNEELKKVRDAENQELQKKKDFVNDVKREYLWGVWTESDEKAAALEEELKKQPKKDPWED